MKRLSTVLLILIVAVSSAFAIYQGFSETAVLVSFVPDSSAVESTISKVSTGGTGKFYLGDSIIRPMFGFGGTLDFMFYDPAGNTDFRLALGLEGFAGVSVVVGQEGLFRVDLAIGASAAENGWMRNLIASLWGGQVKPKYYTSFFGDASVLFGDEEMCVRVGMRVGPYSVKGSDPILIVTPYIACDPELFGIIF